MKKKFIFYIKQKNTQNKSIDLIQFNEKNHLNYDINIKNF
jgi:hypothetical protein